jgi:hypothetical protein
VEIGLHLGNGNVPAKPALVWLVDRVDLNPLVCDRELRSALRSGRFNLKVTFFSVLPVRCRVNSSEIRFSDWANQPKIPLRHGHNDPAGLIMIKARLFAIASRQY